MTWRFSAWMLLAVVGLGVLVSACESTVSYSPYLSRQSFIVNGKCEAFRGEDGVIHYDCGCDNSFRGSKGTYHTIYVEPPLGDACETRIYFDAGEEHVDITLYNVLLPCFPDEVLSEYLNQQSSDGDFDTGGEAGANEYAEQFFAYLVPATTLGSPLYSDTVQLQIVVAPQDLLQDTLCSYRLKARIESIPKGEYRFKLWNYNGEPLEFEHKGNLTNVIKFEI